MTIIRWSFGIYMAKFFERIIVKKLSRNQLLATVQVSLYHLLNQTYKEISFKLINVVSYISLTYISLIINQRKVWIAWINMKTFLLIALMIVLDGSQGSGKSLTSLILIDIDQIYLSIDSNSCLLLHFFHYKFYWCWRWVPWWLYFWP